MIKQKKTSKFKNKFNKSVITGIAVTVGIVSTFSVYFINPKPIFAQEQQQEKTVVIDSKKYHITGILEDRYNLTKEEKKIILEEREKITFERAEKLYKERNWGSAMCRYCYLAYFPKYKEYAIKRAYECIEKDGDYATSISILKDILVIVNKYTPDEQKQKIKSSKLYEEIADTYMRARFDLFMEKGDYYASKIERQYPPIREIDPEYDGFWAN